MTNLHTTEEWRDKVAIALIPLVEAVYKVEGTSADVHAEIDRTLDRLVALRLSDYNSLKEGVESFRENLPKTKCMNAENHLFGSCFACESIKGNNRAIDSVLSLLTNRYKK